MSHHNGRNVGRRGGREDATKSFRKLTVWPGDASDSGRCLFYISFPWLLAILDLRTRAAIDNWMRTNCGEKSPPWCSMLNETERLFLCSKFLEFYFPRRNVIERSIIEINNMNINYILYKYEYNNKCKLWDPIREKNSLPNFAICAQFYLTAYRAKISILFWPQQQEEDQFPWVERHNYLLGGSLPQKGGRTRDVCVCVCRTVFLQIALEYVFRTIPNFNLNFLRIKIHYYSRNSLLMHIHKVSHKYHTTFKIPAFTSVPSF